MTALRVAMVLGGPPNPSTSGTSISNWTLLLRMLERDISVSVIQVGSAESRDPTLEKPLAGTGVDHRFLKIERGSVRRDPLARRITRPRIEDFYPELRLGPRVRDALAEVGADVAYTYGTPMAATLFDVAVPRVSVVVDLEHLPPVYRLRQEARPSPGFLLHAVDVLNSSLKIRRFMPQILSRSDLVVDHAAHHAGWLQRHGVPTARYVPTPVLDPIGDESADDLPQRKSRPTLLLIGHLRGTATTTGLKTLTSSVLPNLDEKLGRNGYEVRIVGRGVEELPHQIRMHLERPNVVFTGHLDDPSAEFLGATALLVPTPIRLGARVRILVGLSYGCPVVAHSANAYGIPELDSGKNCLLGNTGDELADAISEVFVNDRLRLALSREGRRSFDEHFAPKAAGDQLIDCFRQVALKRLPRYG